MLPGFDALTSLTGGGALDTSSSASMDAQNDISTGAVTIGGMQMGSSTGGVDEMLLKGGIAAALALGVVFFLKK